MLCKFCRIFQEILLLHSMLQLDTMKSAVRQKRKMPCSLLLLRQLSDFISVVQAYCRTCVPVLRTHYYFKLKQHEGK